MGAGLGLLIYVYFIGIMAAVAIPAYQDYVVRAQLTNAVVESQQARQELVDYYERQKAIPQTLSEAGVADRLPNDVHLSLDPAHMVLTVHSSRGDLVFTPRRKTGGEIIWVCSAGEGVKAQQLPRPCH
jgi:type II secretory pathway pseudopilin PulG